MPRGGARYGADGKLVSGRKKGSLTKRTQAIASQAAAQGVTPLEVMLDNMRFFHEAAGVALERLLANKATPAQIISEHDPKRADAEQAPTLVDAVKMILELRERAGESAKDAAPYVHPRLSAADAPVHVENLTINSVTVMQIRSDLQEIFGDALARPAAANARRIH